MLCTTALRTIRRPLISLMTRHKMTLADKFTEKPIPIPERLEVKLTDTEDQLCTLLDQCRHDLLEKGQDVECRIAGGWVRDKLLGSDSHDIDIALSNIMGVAFAEHFVDFIHGKGLAAKSVSTIARNPEQSKHLETARTTVLGVEVDFVNLRSEEYAEHSRIPSEIKPGTPLEDSLRRDITMNSLFYNVHTRTVEDYTEKGLEDLRNGVLRTPLPPRETFLDDPLRVIRCIRFASRYGFKMVPEIDEAAKDPEIQAAIVSKISRERVGEELDKMMKGRSPVHSIRLIMSLNLEPSLFAVPPSISATFSPGRRPFHTSLSTAILLTALISSPGSIGLPDIHPLLTSQLSRDHSLRPRLYLASSLTPFRGVSYRGPKMKEGLAVEIVIREALKLGTQNHYIDGVPALFSAADLLQGVDAQKCSGPNERSKTGLLLRHKAVHNEMTGSHWTSSLLFSLTQELSSFWDHETDEFNVNEGVKCVRRYNDFLTKVEDLDLPSAVDVKPMLNGHEVVSTLSATKPGHWTGDVLARVVEWQLDHPTGTKGECADWLRSEQTAGRIDIGPPSKKPKIKK